MLDADEVNVAEIDVVSGADVVLFDVSAYFEFYGVGVFCFRAGSHRDDEWFEVFRGDLFYAIHEIGSEGRDAAFSRRIARYESNLFCV